MRKSELEIFIAFAAPHVLALDRAALELAGELAFKRRERAAAEQLAGAAPPQARGRRGRAAPPSEREQRAARLRDEERELEARVAAAQLAHRAAVDAQIAVVKADPALRTRELVRVLIVFHLVILCACISLSLSPLFFFFFFSSLFVYSSFPTFCLFELLLLFIFPPSQLVRQANLLRPFMPTHAERLILAAGHRVLFTPPTQSQLQPIELLWAYVKCVGICYYNYHSLL